MEQNNSSHAGGREIRKVMDDEPNPIQDLKDAELYDLLPDSETCNCNHKTQGWQHHKQYCPIWKNGRIEELEQAMNEFIKHHEKLGWGYNLKIMEKLKKLLKQ